VAPHRRHDDRVEAALGGEPGDDDRRRDFVDAVDPTAADADRHRRALGGGVEVERVEFVAGRRDRVVEALRPRLVPPRANSGRLRIDEVVDVTSVGELHVGSLAAPVQKLRVRLPVVSMLSRRQPVRGLPIQGSTCTRVTPLHTWK